jgi:dCMP deaminase
MSKSNTINSPGIKEKHKLKLMAQAYAQAECSYATDLKVGALIVKPEDDGTHRIISDGYNGTPPNQDNTCEDSEGNQLPNVIHAEGNAFLKIARAKESSEGCWLFVTRSPCNKCKDLIADGGISAVFYCEGHRDTSPIEYLISKSIYVEQIPKTAMISYFDSIAARIKQPKFNDCGCN